MAIKVDLEKAYNRVRWDTLSDAGLSDYFVSIIMCCVSTVFMQLLWNRTVSESFIPSKGVR